VNPRPFSVDDALLGRPPEGIDLRCLRVTNAGVSFDERAPDPAAATGLARVRITRVAVGSPDVLASRGRGNFTGTLGHAGVGVVESTDDARLAGKRVAISMVVACGRCDRCRAGLPGHCASRATRGLAGAEGSLADFLVAPPTGLVALPDNVDDDAAAFANALAGALHACRLVRVETKPYVTVLGDGPVALLAAQVLARSNASVRVLGRHPARYQLCERWGIKHRAMSEVGLRQDQDVIVDCTGDPVWLGLGARMLRPRGKIVLKSPPTPALFETPPLADLSHVLAAEAEILCAGAGSVADAVAALARRDVDVAPLISRRFRLAQWRAALDAAADHANLMVLVEP